MAQQGVLAQINDPGRLIITGRMGLGASGALVTGEEAGRGWVAAKTGTGTYSITFDFAGLDIDTLTTYCLTLNQDSLDVASDVAVQSYTDATGVLLFTISDGSAAADLAAGSVDFFVVARTNSAIA